jgi:hypothetical protein
MRSVPAETTVFLVAIKTFDLILLGDGTSTREVSPFDRFCNICFNVYNPKLVLKKFSF